jgi:hypothetical protein
MEQRQLAWLITTRSQVRVLVPQPKYKHLKEAEWPLLFRRYAYPFKDDVSIDELSVSSNVAYAQQYEHKHNGSTNKGR